MVLLQINLLEWLETALKFVLRSQSLYVRSQSLYACGARAYMRGARAYMVLKPILVFAWSKSLDLDQAEQFPRQIFASKNFGSKKFKSMKQNVV